MRLSSMTNEIRVIPFPGKPLHFDSSLTTHTLFSGPQRGFLVGPENRALEPIVRWVVEGTIQRDQLPILFYGGSGCGKTHLMNGLFEAWQKNRPKSKPTRRAVLLSSADFLRHFSEALSTRTTDDFRRRYREASLLLIDDIDLFGDKPWAQDELQHTLDALAVRGGIVVLSSRTFPLDGKLFSETLTARLFGGTTLPILMPGEEVRTRFLAELSSAFHLSLSESTLRTLARSLPVSLPALYGTFARMVFEATDAQRTVDAAFVKCFLRNRPGEDRPTMEEIVRRTARHFSLKVVDLRGMSRNKSVALARSVAVYLARRIAGKEIKEIASYFGKRDPSTIRHLIDRIARDLSQDPVLRDHLFRIEGTD